MMGRGGNSYGVFVDPSRLDFDYSGGVEDVSITTVPTAEWNIVSSPDWLTASKYNYITLRVDVPENDTGNFRYGEIVVEHSEDSSVTAIVSISQSPIP